MVAFLWEIARASPGRTGKEYGRRSQSVVASGARHCGKNGFFRNGHPRRLSVNKFHPAGRTPSISTACVKLIDVRVLFQSQYQPLSCRYFKFSEPFDG
jgi:hypothetical protein